MGAVASCGPWTRLTLRVSENIYRPNFAKSGADTSLVVNGSLTIGFGASDSPPQIFYLPDGLNVDITYLKVFLTSEFVDLSYIAQPSPFDTGLAKSVKPTAHAIWDTVLAAIVQQA